MATNYNDILGKRFGKLTPIIYLGDKKYECICDCGNSCIVDRYNLTSGRTRSCGCLVAEQKSRQGAAMGKGNRKALFCSKCGGKHYANGLCRACYLAEWKKKQKEKHNNGQDNN